VHRDRVGWHVALGVEIAVKRAAGRRVVDQLDGANLDDAMTAQSVEAGRLGVDDDFTTCFIGLLRDGLN
jgi:hypothetical protein